MLTGRMIAAWWELVVFDIEENYGDVSKDFQKNYIDFGLRWNLSYHTLSKGFDKSYKTRLTSKPLSNDLFHG